MLLLVEKYRDRIIVVAAWVLALSILTLVIAARTDSTVVEDIWLYLGRPLFVVSVFLLIGLNLSKISNKIMPR